jgi:N-methylhydantoinase A
VPLVAYGGAGGLHAASLMLQLGMPSAVMPSHPGAFSAVGLALAGEATEVTEAVRASLSSGGLTEILARGQELLAQAQGLLNGKRNRGRVEAMVRYQGQGACLRLPLTRRLAINFLAEHQRRFGFATDAPIEIVQLRARAECAASALPAAELPSTATTRRAPTPAMTRRPPLGGRALPIYDRQSLTSQPLHGPAIIEESTATTLVPAKCQLRLSPFGLRIARC